LHVTVGVSEDITALRRFLEERGLHAPELPVITPSLEDVFVVLVNASSSSEAPQ